MNDAATKRYKKHVSEALKLPGCRDTIYLRLVEPSDFSAIQVHMDTFLVHTAQVPAISNIQP